MAIGAELELIPFDSMTHRPVPVVANGHGGTGSLDIMRRIGNRSGWVEIPAGEDPPSWSLPDGSRISFEPGGQIEISSAPSESASALIRDLQCTTQLLAGTFASAGVELEAIGVDPYNDIAEVELQLHRPRYERMTRYFESIGPSGIRMMRQTASLQINIDAGPAPFDRWQLLNALAPYVTAIFANSSRYAGAATAFRSYRAQIWRTLDPGRTGLPVNGADPVGEYLDFALAAGAMMRDDSGFYDRFGTLADRGDVSMDDWELHLSTLFPEVRPKRYFELRSADAIAPEYLAAPIALVAGLVYDDDTSRRASGMLAREDSPSLEAAARDGLTNPQIREMSIRLTDLALSGCESLGDAYISAGDVETAARFFDRYTRQGRSPGDDWG
jgi:glutamate--cysteine ligase